MRNAKSRGEFVCVGGARRSLEKFRISHFAFRILMTRRRSKARKSQPRAQRETSAGGVVFRRGPEGQVRFLLIRDSYKNWGFPKGHLEAGEPPAEAARREVTEETGLDELVLHGPIKVIDWYFRFRGKTIHKYCHFFLFESRRGEPVPEEAEGITACVWHPLDEARQTVSYDNARDVLRQAAEMQQALVQT
jgi:8-oxo-dGTP pyrophosphatase MutT (NUDIX family)